MLAVNPNMTGLQVGIAIIVGIIAGLLILKLLSWWENR